jgi:cytoskeleton protein RodZ
MTETGIESSEVTPALNVGAVLRDAREHGGLSVEDVAGRLKFSPRQIAALEEGDYSQLQGTTFLRGFVRSYAKLLQLDEEPLLAALPGVSAVHGTSLEVNEKGVPLPSKYAASRSNILWLLGAFGVTLLLGLFVWLHDSGQTEKVSGNMPATTLFAASSVTSAMPESAPSAAPSGIATSNNMLPETRPEKREKASLGNHKVPSGAATKSVTHSEKAERPIFGNNKVSGVAATSVMQPATAGVANLHLVFDEDSWVEIADANGTILISRLFLAGTEANLNHVPPYSVVIGNAGGTSLYFKGKQVDLTPYTRINVAHLTLE